MSSNGAYKLPRAVYFLIAPAVCLILFWRAPVTWFRNDDFAWLGLTLDVNRASDLWKVLFSPMAQGTVRVLGDRLYFLVFGSFFDMSAFAVNALPFRLSALATWFASLGLASLIGARLTGSRMAGLAAAILWTSQAALTRPLMWASGYDQLLCTLCVLTAFYARLCWLESGQRRWIAIEWAAYLAGFGALEIIVMYPCVAALHAACFARRRWRSTLPLFVPALLFAAVHFFLIPKTKGPYSVAIDRRLPETFLTYLNWTISPLLIGEPIGGWRVAALISAALTGIALLGFLVYRVLRRDWAPLFFCGWFVLFIAPVLPLPNHVSDYYLTLPALGLAWLGGWAVVFLWNMTLNSPHASRIAARGAIIVVAATYLVTSIEEIEIYSRWFYETSNRMRSVLQAVDDAADRHPGSALLLAGADQSLIDSGLVDHPFRLYGLDNVYLFPDAASEAAVNQNAEDFGQYMVTVPKALDLVDHFKARILLVSGDSVTDVTRTYAAILHTGTQVSRHDFVNAGDPGYAAQLGSTWYKAEGGARWMPMSASVHLYEINPAARNFSATGYASPEVVAAGPVKIYFRGNGQDIGSAAIEKPAGPFSFSFPLPAPLIGQSSVQIDVELSRVWRPAGEERDLGMVFGTFAIR